MFLDVESNSSKDETKSKGIEIHRTKGEIRIQIKHEYFSFFSF